MNDDYMRHTRIANAVQSPVSRAALYHQVTEQEGRSFKHMALLISIGAVHCASQATEQASE